MKSRPQLLRGVIEAGQERLLPRCPHRVGRRHKQEGCVDLLGLLGRVAPPGMALGLRARAERAVSGQCAAGRGAPSPYRGALVPPLGRDATHNKTRPTRSASPGTASSKRRRGAGGARGKRAHLGGSEGLADGPSGEPRTGAGFSPRREPGGAEEEDGPLSLPSWLCGPPETSQAGSDPLGILCCGIYREHSPPYVALAADPAARRRARHRTGRAVRASCRWRLARRLRQQRRRRSRLGDHERQRRFLAAVGLECQGHSEHLRHRSQPRPDRHLPRPARHHPEIWCELPRATASVCILTTVPHTAQASIL